MLGASIRIEPGGAILRAGRRVNGMSSRLNGNLQWRLSVLWFLEWSISGTIMTYLPIYWDVISLSKREQGQLMAVTAIGLWVSPFLVGQVADRWLAIEKYLALSHFAGGVTLYLLATAAELYGVTGANFPTLLVLFGIFAVAYFPTVPLASALCFRHLSDPDSQFGKIRVWGTVGWIAAGLGLSFWLAHDQVFTWLTRQHPTWGWVQELQGIFVWLPEPSQSDCFRMSGLLSFALSSFCIFLPHTPPIQTARDRVAPLAILGMFRERGFTLFMVISFLLAVLIVPLYSLAVPGLLQSLGVAGAWVPTVMLIGQISEFPALLLLPVSLRRLGMKATFALGIGAWAVRYLLFSAGIPWWLVLFGLALHGVCHVYLVIVAQLFIDSRCRPDLKASAQALLSFITLGIGMPVGALLGGWLHQRLHEDLVLLFAIPAVAAIVLLVVFWMTVPMDSAEETQAREEGLLDNVTF